MTFDRDEEAIAGFERTGGPAFPADWSVPSGGKISSPGLTVRDWFAGQALAGMMAQSHTGPKDWTHMGHGWGEDCVNSLNKHEKHVAMSLASFAYELADAMLAERSKP